MARKRCYNFCELEDGNIQSPSSTISTSDDQKAVKLKKYFDCSVYENEDYSKSIFKEIDQRGSHEISKTTDFQYDRPSTSKISDLSTCSDKKTLKNLEIVNISQTADFQYDGPSASESNCLSISGDRNTLKNSETVNRRSKKKSRLSCEDMLIVKPDGGFEGEKMNQFELIARYLNDSEDSDISVKSYDGMNLTDLEDSEFYKAISHEYKADLFDSDIDDKIFKQIGDFEAKSLKQSYCNDNLLSSKLEKKFTEQTTVNKNDFPHEVSPHVDECIQKQLINEKCYEHAITSKDNASTSASKYEFSKTENEKGGYNNDNIFSKLEKKVTTENPVEERGSSIGAYGYVDEFFPKPKLTDEKSSEDIASKGNASTFTFKYECSKPGEACYKNLFSSKLENNISNRFVEKKGVSYGIAYAAELLQKQVNENQHEHTDCTVSPVFGCSKTDDAQDEIQEIMEVD